LAQEGEWGGNGMRPIPLQLVWALGQLICAAGYFLKLWGGGGGLSQHLSVVLMEVSLWF